MKNEHSFIVFPYSSAPDLIIIILLCCKRCNIISNRFRMMHICLMLLLYCVLEKDNNWR